MQFNYHLLWDNKILRSWIDSLIKITFSSICSNLASTASNLIVSSEAVGLGHHIHLAMLQQLNQTPLNCSKPLIFPRIDRNWLSLVFFSCSLVASVAWCE